MKTEVSAEIAGLASTIDHVGTEIATALNRIADALNREKSDRVALAQVAEAIDRLTNATC